MNFIQTFKTSWKESTPKKKTFTLAILIVAVLAMIFAILQMFLSERFSIICELLLSILLFLQAANHWDTPKSRKTFLISGGIILLCTALSFYNMYL